ncbi:MAG: CapA family protein [Ruminococcus sp.]
MDKKKKFLICALAGAMALVIILVMSFSFCTGADYTSTPDEAPTTFPEATAASTAPAPDPVILSFTGDSIVGSESGSAYEGGFTWYARNKSHDYFFKGVYDVLSKDDLTFANCECVLTDRSLEKTYKDYSPAFWFKAPASDADIFKLGSVEVAGVVNNHTKDYGEEGYQDTIKALEAQGLTVGEDCVPLYFDVKGIRIGMVYAHLWASYHLSYVEDALAEMEGNCDYKIVFFHGGEEGIHNPDNYKIDCARKLANENQCDLIIGSHPHVLQPMEIVNGVPIVYSIGNFCYSGSSYPENMTVIFQVMLTKENGEISTATRLIPCYVYTGDSNNWQPMVMTNQKDIDEVMELMNTKVEYRYGNAEENTDAPQAQTDAQQYTPDPAPAEDSPEEIITEAYIPPAAEDDNAESETYIGYY